MTISSADSWLHVCSVMFSHGILESVGLVAYYAYQIKLARLVSLIIGLFAIIVAFCCNNLIELIIIVEHCYIPIVAAPFILAIFSFQGTSGTALIGMVTRLRFFFGWERWIAIETGINGSFISMVINGLAMMAAHYLLKQPPGRGWVGLDGQKGRRKPRKIN